MMLDHYNGQEIKEKLKKRYKMHLKVADENILIILPDIISLPFFPDWSSFELLAAACVRGAKGGLSEGPVY